MLGTVALNLVKETGGEMVGHTGAVAPVTAADIRDTYSPTLQDTNPIYKATAAYPSTEDMIRRMGVNWMDGKRPLTDKEVKQVVALVRNLPPGHLRVLYNAGLKICIVDPDNPNIPFLKDGSGKVVNDSDGKPIKCPEEGWPGGIKMSWNCGAYYWGAKSADGEKVIAFPRAKLEGPGLIDKTGDSLAMVHEMGHAFDDLSTPDAGDTGANPWNVKTWSGNLNEQGAAELKSICKTSCDKGNWWAKSHLGGSLADRSTGEYIANGFMMLYSTPDNRKVVMKNDPALVAYISRVEQHLGSADK